MFRVSSWAFENMVVKLDCVRLAATALPASASPGRVLGAADAVAGTTIVHAFEIPPLDDAVLSAPRLSVAAAGGAGWRRAALLYSLDGGAHWTAAGATTGVATLGVLATAPGAGPAGMFDCVTRFEVELAHEDMALAGADDDALDAGANTALVGDELIQFGAAEQIGARRWRLSRLLRGQRASEDAIGSQSPGDRFISIEADALTTIDLPLSSKGTTVRVIASGIGDPAGPASADAVVAGRSVLPLAPVHLTVHELGGGDALVRWVRRSRAGWRWIDGADAPLAEEAEAYRVTISGAGGAMRMTETAMPEITVSAADRSGGAVSISVRQAGSHGESPAAMIGITALSGA